jgi:hypothetical protein
MSLIQAELNDLLKKVIEEEIKNIKTITVGKITKLNGNTVNVRPVMSASVGGVKVDLPEFVNVPFHTMQGGTSYIIMPIAVGDYCLLYVCERDFDNWWLGSDYEKPRTYQIHDYSNTIAHVGLNNTRNSIYIPNTIKMVGDTVQEGNYTHTGNRDQTGDFVLNGNQTINNGTLTIPATSDITIDGISLRSFITNHTHSQGNDSNGNTEQDTNPPNAVP